MLTLRILTMTDEEKREMAATDPRARALLERTEAMTPTEIGRLHGALRSRAAWITQASRPHWVWRLTRQAASSPRCALPEPS